MERQIAVIDFGSQYTQLIVRRIRELGYFSKLYQPTELRETGNPAAVILSGGPRSVTDEDAPDIDFEYLKSLGVPVLGVCYGMQLLNVKHGGEVIPSDRSEYGPSQLIPEGECPLFVGLSASSQIWMSHSDTCGNLGETTTVVAKNQHGVPVALDWGNRFYGIQFHPEVSHSHEGNTLLKNFIELADDVPRFEIASFKDHLVAQIRETVNGRKVVCGVSGGVDSTVLAVLLNEADIEMRAIFVDNGLLRKNEAKEVQEQFDELGVEIEVIDAGDLFLGRLAGIDDPEEKRAIIGNTFLDVFWDAVGEEIQLLAQGTLYPDVIESATSGSMASTIKTHHNRVPRVVALQAEGRVIEPLDELFKDEVRALGEVLKIPKRLLYRHPFPGPGLAVRVPGEVTPHKLAITREADAVFMRELRDGGWYDKIWQAYAALIPVKTVGVKGDVRSYEFALSLRAVTSEDAMTAEPAEMDWKFLKATANAILNEVDGVNRVLYDVSTKPPASIEWE